MSVSTFQLYPICSGRSGRLIRIGVSDLSQDIYSRKHFSQAFHYISF